MKRLLKKASPEAQAYVEKIKQMTDIVNNVCISYGEKHSELIVDTLRRDGVPKDALINDVIADEMIEEITLDPRDIISEIIKAVAAKLDGGFAQVKQEVAEALGMDNAFVSQIAAKAAENAWGPSNI